MGCGDKEALDDSAVCLTGPGGHRRPPPPTPTLAVCRLPFIGLLFFFFFLGLLGLKSSGERNPISRELFVPHASLCPSVHPILPLLDSLRRSLNASQMKTFGK